MQEYESLDVSQEDDVLRIAFDRPDEHNSIDEGTHKELGRVFRDAASTDARVVIFTGNGDAFSAGGDFNMLKEGLEDQSVFLESMRRDETMLKDLVNLEKPVIARLNGDATGLGATLALFSDIVIAAEGARIGDPHVKAGLVAGDGGAVVWPLLTSMSKAKELLMTGDLISATKAEDIGLVNYAVPEEELDEKVDEMVEKLATGPQLAIQFTKLAVNGWLEFGMNNILRESMALEGLSQAHEDHAEAVESFLEKRRPNFPSGRNPE